jgi:hypothetical protein
MAYFSGIIKVKVIGVGSKTSLKILSFIARILKVKLEAKIDND